MKNLYTVKIENEWFEKGLDYALKSWTSTFNRMGKPNPYTRIEKIILGLIAESAVEHYLIENNIEYNTSGKTKWYEEDRYDIGIGNYAIDVKANFLDLNKPYIISSYVKNDKKKEWIKKCHALVPLDQFNPGKNLRRKIKKEKIYIFPFIVGRYNENKGNECLIHAFWDYRWLKRAEHKNLPHLGELHISYKGTNNGKIKIYGTTDKNKIIVEDVAIKPGVVKTKNNFFQTFGVRWFGSAPDGTLIIEANNLKLTEIISAENKFELIRNDNKKYIPSLNNWQNLALYDGSVFISGWINEKEMRIIGDKIPRFAKNILQYSETKVDNWACKVNELESMEDLKNTIS